MEVSQHPALTAIAAVGSNRVIGDGYRLPWNYPEDFDRFKQVTMGGVLVMGRRTFDSLGGALPGRTSIVLTRDKTWVPPGVDGDPYCDDMVEVVHTLQEVGTALSHHSDAPWWSIGGGEIYQLMWPYTTHLDLTEVHHAPRGTVTFPVVESQQWRETSREPREDFDFVTYVRRDGQAVAALETLISRPPHYAC
ncbi:MAG: dihydrofolate reductase [Propionibacteriaceae bacterium]|nr:dihydrofolate reductase [Propionibacteriaceae bacterium]